MREFRETCGCVQHGGDGRIPLHFRGGLVRWMCPERSRCLHLRAMADAAKRERESGGKSTCVGNHVFHGLRAEGSNTLSRAEDANQPFVFGWMGNCHRGSLVRPLLAGRLQGQPRHGGVGLVLANGWQFLQTPQVCRGQSCGLRNSLARELVVVHLRAHRLPP